MDKSTLCCRVDVTWGRTRDSGVSGSSGSTISSRDFAGFPRGSVSPLSSAEFPDVPRYDSGVADSDSHSSEPALPCTSSGSHGTQTGPRAASRARPRTLATPKASGSTPRSQQRTPGSQGYSQYSDDIASPGSDNPRGVPPASPPLTFSPLVISCNWSNPPRDRSPVDVTRPRDQPPTRPWGAGVFSDDSDSDDDGMVYRRPYNHAGDSPWLYANSSDSDTSSDEDDWAPPPQLPVPRVLPHKQLYRKWQKLLSDRQRARYVASRKGKARGRLGNRESETGGGEGALIIPMCAGPREITDKLYKKMEQLVISPRRPTSQLPPQHQQNHLHGHLESVKTPGSVIESRSPQSRSERSVSSGGSGVLLPGKRQGGTLRSALVRSRRRLGVALRRAVGSRAEGKVRTPRSILKQGRVYEQQRGWPGTLCWDRKPSRDTSGTSSVSQGQSQDWVARRSCPNHLRRQAERARDYRARLHTDSC